MNSVVVFIHCISSEDSGFSDVVIWQFLPYGHTYQRLGNLSRLQL